jgi:HEPN domain-containing protein
MTEAEKKHLYQWIEKAEHDLLAAKLIVDQQPLILDIACFHCQQAVEKYLKTYLVYKKEEFPKTHNLDLLQQMCSNYQAAFANIDLKNMEDFAVRRRYPHDFIRPELEETQEFIEITETVKAFVLKQIDIS